MPEIRARQTGSTAGDLPTFDAWTPLDFKESMAPGRKPGAGAYGIGGAGWMAPTWVGDHGRRLQAYIVQQAFIDNAARYFLTTQDIDIRDRHREYGDAHLLVRQVVAALIGNEQNPVVEGASDWVEDLPQDAPEQDRSKSDEAKPAHDLQDWFEDWWDKERLPIKLIEAESDAVGLGDGVYVLAWSGRKKRVRLSVYDPGFYFPIVDDGNDDDYPSKVHIAWQLPPEEDGSDKGKLRVRRKTWELRKLPEGQTRSYPYAGEGEDASEWTCYFTDAVWTLENSAIKGIEHFRGAVRYIENSDGVECKDLDLEIDFIPVVHEPNTPAVKEHYGRSVLASVMQVLDDIANVDTDLNLASATTGSPPVALSGVSVKRDPKTGEVQNVTYRPGKVWELGENGKLEVLDTSRSLDALLKMSDWLLKRLSTNSRVPEALLGRMDPGEIKSGIHLRLLFGPLEQLIREMRLVRDEKHPLLLKFVWRMAIAGKQADVPKRFFPSRIALGSILPTDEAAVIEQVTAAYGAKLISLETAVQMLIEIGLPIEDLVEEVRRIERRDFKGAAELLDALGDDDAVFGYLQRDKPADLEVQPPPEGGGAAPPAQGGQPLPPGSPPPPPVNLPPA